MNIFNTILQHSAMFLKQNIELKFWLDLAILYKINYYSIGKSQNAYHDACKSNNLIQMEIPLK